jgi:hypothetical protein
MAHAGKLATLNISSFDSQEQEIITKFSKVWFISFARQAKFKNSDVTFVFAKPTDKLTKDFHLTREVLVVFTPYNSFEPRTLDFVDKTIFEYQNRLDKLCVLLISRDNDIKSKIRSMALQDKETRVIVPFSYSEFSGTLNPENNIILRRLKEFFYERDLFAFDSPLRNDTYFFGRSQTIQALYGKYKSGENGCLFGLRRIGKTSVLLAVKRYLDLREEPAVFLDCSETSFHRRRWYEALHFIIQALAHTLNIPNTTQLHSIDDYTDKEASRSFEEDLRTIQQSVGMKRILIILDEIENITFGISPSDHWSKDKDYIFFWQSVRSIFQKNSDLFSFIIAGVNPKAIETATVQSFDNPIYRLVTPNYLGFFDVQQVREMVSSIGNYMGLVFEDEVFTYLTDDYGGHPFLIRQVCSRLHKIIAQARPFTITRFRYQIEREELSKYIQDYISLIVSVLQERYKDEYELLEHLAQGDQKTFQDFVQMSHSIIEHLEGYGLVKEDQDHYYFRIKAVEDYIRERTKVARILVTKEDKWKEITTQRNKLETDLRRVIKLTLKLHFGQVKAKEVFLEIISPPERKNRLAASNLDEIFESELYFEDLRKIIIKQWSELGRIFNNDKDNFQTYMKYVNRHRADAHANDIDDGTLGILLIALQWLQNQVNGFLD